MLDVLETLLPEHFVALDLACGPGSMSQRLLSRFPQARSVAVDIDPILLLLGQQVLGDMQGRLRWMCKSWNCVSENVVITWLIRFRRRKVHNTWQREKFSARCYEPSANEAEPLT